MYTSSVSEIIKEIQRADLSKIPLCILEEKIIRLFKNYTHTETLRAPPSGDRQWRFHRSIKYHHPPSHIKELGYPPAHVVNLGRANFAKNPVFYCSGDPRATFFELNLAPGDAMVLSLQKNKGNFGLGRDRAACLSKTTFLYIKSKLNYLDMMFLA